MIRILFAGLVVAGLVAAGLVATSLVHAETPAHVCRRVGSDNEFRTVPHALLDKVKAAFGADAGTAGRGKEPIWRCMAGKVVVCVPGGERYCGRADTQVMATSDSVAFCQAHPGSATIPSAVTGRDTIFRWSCDGTSPKNEGAVRTVDPRGFVADYWKVIE